MRQELSSGTSPGTEIHPGGIDDFDALVRAHRPRILRFLLASLRDREAAENLTQDCFVRAYKARAQFRGDAVRKLHLADADRAPATWCGIAEGSGRLKFWRRTLRQDLDLNDVSDWVPDQQRSPEAIASAKEQVRAVWNAAAGLSERQRTVFLLRFVEDMDLLEIAAVTGMKEGTVKAHLFRALQAVRSGLGEKK